MYVLGWADDQIVKRYYFTDGRLEVQAKADVVKRLQPETQAELDRAFKGEL